MRLHRVKERWTSLSTADKLILLSMAFIITTREAIRRLPRLIKAGVLDVVVAGGWLGLSSLDSDILRVGVLCVMVTLAFLILSVEWQT